MLGVALSTVAGLAGWVIGGLIVLEWVVQPLLTHLDALGALRTGCSAPPLTSFARSDAGPLQRAPGELVHAWITIVVWMAVALAIGAWRVVTRDA